MHVDCVKLFGRIENIVREGLGEWEARILDSPNTLREDDLLFEAYWENLKSGFVVLPNALKQWTWRVDEGRGK